VAPPPHTAVPHLSTSVQITGAWNGVVLCWPSDRSATRATVILFAIGEESVRAADIQDFEGAKLRYCGQAPWMVSRELDTLALW
jgi:hypothetical protein